MATTRKINDLHEAHRQLIAEYFVPIAGSAMQVVETPYLRLFISAD